MKVFVACESSGVVRRAFEARGHEAWSCDLVEAEDGAARHIQADAIETAGAGGWDLMVAHPPCTYLASSGLHWTARGHRDPRLTDEAIAFVLALMAAPIPRIAIENPVGCIGTRIRPADQYVQPWQYGDDASKTTGLWLEGLPLLVPTGPRITPRLVDGRPRWANQTDSGQNCLAPSEDRWRQRSTTYPGIAAAMADQWGDPSSSLFGAALAAAETLEARP